MASPLADPQDIEGIWRGLSDAETVIATGQIRYASAMVRQQVPSVDARVEAGTLDSDLVRGVVASMVQRVLMNPGRNRVVAIDDTRLEKDASISTGELYLSATELASLQPSSVVGSSSAGAFSIRFPGVPFAVSPRACYPADVWYPVV